jgi:hypothetical protein
LQNTADTATIREVALLRLGIALVFEKGVQNRKWLSNLLGNSVAKLIVDLSLYVTNQLIAQLQREGFIIKKATVHRRYKYSFDPVVNQSTILKKRDIFSNDYFDEIFLSANHASPRTNNKRTKDLVHDTVRDDGLFPGVRDMESMTNQPKKRKVSVARKTLVVL